MHQQTRRRGPLKHKMTKSTHVANSHINEIKIGGMQEVIEVNQNLVEDVGKAVVSCPVVGSICGFVFMAKKQHCGQEASC